MQDGTEVKELTAREISGDERAHWWELAVAAYPPYAEYQTKTDRQIRCSFWSDPSAARRHQSPPDPRRGALMLYRPNVRQGSGRPESSPRNSNRSSSSRVRSRSSPGAIRGSYFVIKGEY